MRQWNAHAAVFVLAVVFACAPRPTVFAGMSEIERNRYDDCRMRVVHCATGVSDRDCYWQVAAEYVGLPNERARQVWLDHRGCPPIVTGLRLSFEERIAAADRVEVGEIGIHGYAIRFGRGEEARNLESGSPLPVRVRRIAGSAPCDSLQYYTASAIVTIALVGSGGSWSGVIAANDVQVLAMESSSYRMRICGEDVAIDDRISDVRGMVFGGDDPTESSSGSTPGGATSGSGGYGGGGSVQVGGYTRSNGTYVAPYSRAAPGHGGGGHRR